MGFRVGMRGTGTGTVRVRARARVSVSVSVRARVSVSVGVRAEVRVRVRSADLAHHLAHQDAPRLDAQSRRNGRLTRRLARVPEAREI